MVLRFGVAIRPITFQRGIDSNRSRMIASVSVPQALIAAISSAVSRCLRVMSTIDQRVYGFPIVAFQLFVSSSP
ncbi:MAG TPA: hypothetical protein VEK79_00200 [Thermoanaerobaculia bacterium]|nr:hypothetical protein [Thermoanaerobaculia bacterium]